MRIFVSYTARDGMVTPAMLHRLHAHLSGVCNPFIHMVERRNLRWQQIGVLWALLLSHAVLLVESPAVTRSRWVRLELWLARIRFCPIMRLNAADLQDWTIGP